MKKDMGIIVGLMITVIVVCMAFLWTMADSADDMLGDMDPDSFDVETTCTKKDRQYLICNEGNDMYLLYDDVEFYHKKVDTIVKENGDEEIQTTYKSSSINELEGMLKQNQPVLMNLWLTEQGQIQIVMIVESTYTNNNLSLKNLEGLDPNSYNATNMVLSVDREGMKLAPVNYTAEEKDKFTDFIGEYAFAEKVKYYVGTVTMISGDGGTQTRNVQYSKISYDDVIKMKSGFIAHIWLDKEGKISHVLVHREVKK